MAPQTEKHDSYAIEIGGDKHTLRLSYAAFRFAQQEHDSDLDLTEFVTGFDPAKIASLCWIGLLHEDSELTETEVIKQLMGASDDENDRIMFVLGKAMAKLASSVDNFTKGAESIQGVNSQKTKTMKKASKKEKA